MSSEAVTEKGGFCWAAPLGGCEGPITREHLVSASLLKGFTWHEINRDPTSGPHAVETVFGELRAPILCKRHNEELGRTADFAALRLAAHLKATTNPMVLPGSRILRSPIDRRVSGVNLGRWLCKTHCNIMFANGATPDIAYASYALARPLPRQVHFYIPVQVGQKVHLADGRLPRVSWKQLINDRRPDIDMFSITLGGFETLVSTEELVRRGSRMVDRIRVLQQPTPLGVSRIMFDWSSEPPVVAIS